MCVCLCFFACVVWIEEIVLELMTLLCLLGCFILFFMALPKGLFGKMFIFSRLLKQIQDEESIWKMKMLAVFCVQDGFSFSCVLTMKETPLGFLGLASSHWLH